MQGYESLKAIDLAKSRKFYAVLAAVAFGLNWIWEMAQMSVYTAEVGGLWSKSFLFCTLASVIDAATTMAICALLKFLMKGRDVKFYLSAAISGALCAVGFEWFALHFGLWSYGERMIVLPILGVGLLPFVQLTLLVPLAIRLTNKFTVI